MTKYIAFSGTKLADILGISTASLNQKLHGKQGDDTLTGGLGNDKIKGGDGADWIVAGAGNDDIDGGKGIDTAVYSGAFSDYRLTFKPNGDGTVQDLVAGRDGTDTLKKVEFLKFSDGIYDIANDTFQFFNRAPTLNAPAAIAFNDTAAHDTFTTAAAALVATDPDNDTLTYSLAGGAPDHTLAGYDVSDATAYGTMYLNSTSGAYAFVPNSAAIEALKSSNSVSFAFTASDGEFSDSKPLAVTLNGVNDTATIIGPAAGNLAEDGTLTAGGALAVNDPDIGDADFKVPAPASLVGSYGSFTFDPSSGVWSYALANDSAAVQQLASDATVHDMLIVTSLDGSANRTIDVAITGTNDAPELYDPVGTGQSLTQTDLTLTASVAFSDVDVADVHDVMYAPVGTGYLGTFTAIKTMDSTNGVQGLIALQFHLTKAQVDAAGGNVPQHQDYTITIDDHHGGVRSETISIPLAEILNNAGNGGGGGNNTDPLIFINPTAHDAATGTVFDDFGHPDRQHLIERLSFSDAEPAQTHSVGDAVGIDPGPLGILGTMFLSVLRNTDGTTTGPVPDPDGFLAASATGGVLKWDYQVDESKIQWFGEGETYTDKFQFMLTDDHGGMTTQEVAVTIQGQNDLPILGGDAQGVLSLDFDLSPVPPSSNIEQTHSFTFIDPDRTDTHTIWAELDSSTVGASVGVLTADLIEDTYTSGVHDENGQIRWTYHLNQAPTAQGQQIWDILIDDGHGITKVPFTVDFHL